MPSAPADIKAISLDPHSVLVSWLPPHKLNGEIVHYSVFMKTMENGRQFTQNYEVYPPNSAFSVRGLNQVRMLLFSHSLQLTPLEQPVLF